MSKSTSNKNGALSLNNNSMEVSMKNVSKLKLAAQLKFEQEQFIKQWHKENAALIEPVIEEQEVFAKADHEAIAEELVNMYGEAIYSYTGKRGGASVKLVEETSSVDLTQPDYLSDSEINELSDEELAELLLEEDDGGIVADVAAQHSASIMTGNQELITKRSSIYEDGGNFGLVRCTDLLSINSQWMTRKAEQAFIDAEDRYTYGLVAEMTAKFEAKREIQVAMRDFAYASFAALAEEIKSAASYKDAKAIFDNSTITVNQALVAEFGSNYIYEHCMLTNKHGTHSMQDWFFIVQRSKLNAVLKEVWTDSYNAKCYAAYERVRKVINNAPVDNKLLPAYIASHGKAAGLDKQDVKLALSHAYNNQEARFPMYIYTALRNYSQAA